jgi:hypothetical protein
MAVSSTVGLSATDPVEELHAMGVTDGLPVVLPTPEVVTAFVAAGGGDGDELVAVVPPMSGRATVATIASNAVMAGCLPAHMPVVLAGVRAMCRDEFNLFGVRTSNHPASPLFIVSGRVVQQLGFGFSTNVFGPNSRASATVGRALNLIIQNIGGATPGLVDQSVMGHAGRFTACIGEDPDSPWEPLHVARGLPPGSSAVTAFAADAPTSVADYASTMPEDLAAAFAFHVSNVWRNPYYALSEVMLIPNISHARVLASTGWGRAEVISRVGALAREACGTLPFDASGHDYEGGIHLMCAGGPWGQYSALVTGWVGPGPGSTITTEEVRP